MIIFTDANDINCLWLIPFKCFSRISIFPQARLFSIGHSVGVVQGYRSRSIIIFGDCFKRPFEYFVLSMKRYQDVAHKNFNLFVLSKYRLCAKWSDVEIFLFQFWWEIQQKLKDSRDIPKYADEDKLTEDKIKKLNPKNLWINPWKHVLRSCRKGSHGDHSCRPANGIPGE